MSYRNQAATSSTSNNVALETSAEMLATSTSDAAPAVSLVIATSSAPAATVNTAKSAVNKTAVPPPIRFEVVTTSAEQQLGLSNRAVVPDNYAMLFAFPTDGDYGFWMIDMLVPLDMIWLSDSGVILKIDADVSPATYPDVFYPPQPVKYVLETRAGFAAERGWVVGTKVALPAPY